MIQAILFDLDNTLIDFMTMKNAACDAAIDAMIDAGLQLDRAEARTKLFKLYDKHGLEYKNIFDDFLKETEGTVDYRKLARGIIAYRNSRAYHLRPYPGVPAMLSTLRAKGIRMAIVSDAPKLKAWMRLCNMDLDKHFDFVIAFDDTGKTKPDKEPFEKALSLLKLPPGQVLMVGDRPGRDIKGAKAIGMQAAFAAYGGSDEPCDNADYILKEPRDLLKIV